MKNKDLNEYLDLNWHYVVQTAKDENNKTYYIIHVEELPGVATDAYSIEEALELIKDAVLGIFKLYIKHGEKIPVPIDEEHSDPSTSLRMNGSEIVCFKSNHKLLKESS